MNRKAAETLPPRLRKALAAKGMTIEGLALAAGLSASGIKKWLSEESAPRANNLRRAAEALGVTVGWLMGEGDDLPSQLAPEPTEVTAAPVPQPAPPTHEPPPAPRRLFGSVKLDWLDEAFRDACARGGIAPEELGDTAALMLLTLLLYDARTQRSEVEKTRTTESYPQKLPQD